MKQFSLTLFLICLIPTFVVGQVMQTNQSARGHITSNGEITYRSTKCWWGVAVSDTAWETCGKYFEQTQIELLKERGATAVRIMLDKGAWDSGDDTNVLGIAYPDYVKQLVQWCHPELKVLLDLRGDLGMAADFTWYHKKEIIENPALRKAWINWGKDVIAYCRPDAIGIMNEPTNAVDFNQFYNDFVIPSIEAYRSVDPTINVFIMQAGNIKNFIGTSVVDMPYVNFEFHIYYDPSSGPSEWERAYVNGDLENAKSLLYNWLDERFSTIPKERILFGEVGVSMEKGETKPSIPNWEAFLKDIYYYTRSLNMFGLMQWAFSKTKYLMLDPRTGYTTFTEYGEFCVENYP